MTIQIKTIGCKILLVDALHSSKYRITYRRYGKLPDLQGRELVELTSHSSRHHILHGGGSVRHLHDGDDMITADIKRQEQDKFDEKLS